MTIIQYHYQHRNSLSFFLKEFQFFFKAGFTWERRRSGTWSLERCAHNFRNKKGIWALTISMAMCCIVSIVNCIWNYKNCNVITRMPRCPTHICRTCILVYLHERTSTKSIPVWVIQSSCLVSPLGLFCCINNKISVLTHLHLYRKYKRFFPKSGKHQLVYKTIW